MAGKLDLPSPSKETPRPQIRRRDPPPKSTGYSPVLEVPDSPADTRTTEEKAKAQSLQEDFDKKMLRASGRKSRRRKSKKSKKTKRR